MYGLNAELFSFNVRGLGQKLKRNIVFNYLKRKSSKAIFLLQECHSCIKTETNFKADWGGEIYFSHGTTDSCGLAILLSPGLDLDIIEEPTNNPGRSQFIKIKLSDNEDLLLGNLYAPTRNKVQEQLDFLSKLKTQLESFQYVDLLLGGDFNTVFDPELDKQGGDMTNCTNQYTTDLLNFMESYLLVDVLRLMHPNKKMFTRVQRTPLVLSRIDHWLMSEHMCNYISSSTVIPGIKSDHSIINLNLCFSENKRGRGFWKFNAQILHDIEYVQKVKTIVSKLEADLVNMEDKGLKWDYMKCEIRTFTLSYSITKNKQKRELLKDLNKKLEKLHNSLSNNASDTVLANFETVKRELESLELEEARGAIIRSKAQWAEAGEKNTKYFLNLEKRNAINKTITKLETNSGSIVKKQQDILIECKDFYKHLYTEPTVDNDNEHSNIETNFFIKEHPTLTDESKIFCEGFLTMGECTKAVKDMKNGKSPGTDGFTVEWYRFFWADINKFVLDSLNYAYATGELSIDQRRGIITLIPKKGKRRIILKNWRPISLLNIDYKILTKSLAFRLKKVLPHIIDDDQTGFLEGRYIGENIRTIADLIEYTSFKNMPGIILLIDFEKAFDTVSWKYIIKCLKYFNFGDSFIHWIKVLYNNIESRVINNGHASDHFSLSRGIRQGCPISPYLFIIAVEVLAIAIRANKNIRGIRVGSTEIKLSQLADDTTLILLDMLSVKESLSCLQDFHIISGLKVNMEKTIGKGIGTFIDFTPDDTCGIRWTTGALNTLGLIISDDPDILQEQNFQQKLQNMTDILNIWLSRNLSLNGKVTILKSLALPKIQYPASCLPITNDIVKETEQIISKFMWNHKRPKVKKSVIIQSIDNGGIKAPDFSSIVKANRVSWIKRLISSKGKWKSILSDLIHPISIEHFIQTNLSDEDIACIPMPFYRQVLRYWNDVKQQPDIPIHYMQEILWNNKYIQTPSKIKSRKTHSIFNKKMYNAGIVRIQDLLDVNGNILDFNNFTNRYNIQCNILMYYKIVKAIPSQWLSKIKQYFQLNSFRIPIDNNYNYCLGCNDFTLDIYTASTKAINCCFIKRKYEIPSALTKWESIFDISSDWKHIFRVPYACTRETQLQALQYRIIHRFMPCKKWLHDISIVNSNICNECNEIDTINHFLFSCTPVQTLWVQIEKWWNETSDCPVVLTEKHVLFGIFYDLAYFSAINYVILVAKMHIYRQKLNEKSVCFNFFLSDLRFKLEIEKIICENNDTLTQLKKKWEKILNSLLII